MVQFQLSYVIPFNCYFKKKMHSEWKEGHFAEKIFQKITYSIIQISEVEQS